MKNEKVTDSAKTESYEFTAYGKNRPTYIRFTKPTQQIIKDVKFYWQLRIAQTDNKKRQPIFYIRIKKFNCQYHVCETLQFAFIHSACWQISKTVAATISGETILSPRSPEARNVMLL